MLLPSVAHSFFFPVRGISCIAAEESFYHFTSSMQLLKPLLLACMPVCHLAVSAAIFSVALHCSDQSNRRYLLPLFIISSVLSFTSSKYLWFVPGLTSLWSQAVLLYILHVISLLCIEKWPAPRSSARPSTQPDTAPKQEWHLDLRITYRLWGNPRLLWASSAPDARSPAGTQSYSVFIFLRLVKLPILYYLNFHVIPSLFSETIGVILPKDVSPTQQVLLRRFQDVTVREAVIRGYTAMFWIWESVVYLDGANSILACFFVLTGLDTPNDWPALFGSPTSASSLRNFWSQFWHKLALRPYTNHGKLLASHLALQPGSSAFNSIVALVVFGLSGATHAAVSWQLGQPDWHLDMGWFLLNFLGCSVEVMWLSTIRASAKKMGWSQELKMIEDSWFGKLVGFAWVFGFFFWSVPKWKYPAMHKEALDTAMWMSLLSKMNIVRG
jgi:hypothetical protein